MKQYFLDILFHIIYIRKPTISLISVFDNEFIIALKMFAK